MNNKMSSKNPIIKPKKISWIEGKKEWRKGIHSCNLKTEIKEMFPYSYKRGSELRGANQSTFSDTEIRAANSTISIKK